MFNLTKSSIPLKWTPLPITFAMANWGLIGSERTLLTTSSNATCLTIIRNKNSIQVRDCTVNWWLFCWFFWRPNKPFGLDWEKKRRQALVYRGFDCNFGSMICLHKLLMQRIKLVFVLVCFGKGLRLLTQSLSLAF